MFATQKKSKKHYIFAALLLAVVFAVSACSGGPKPTPTATPAIAMPNSSFEDGRGFQVGFKLLYALDEQGGNDVLGTTGLAETLAAVKDGATGKTDAGLAAALGMQEMLPRQINDAALHMRQTIQKLTQGKITEAWGLFIPQGLYVKESYNSDMRQSFQMTPRFLEKDLTNDTFNKYLGEWLDDSTNGALKTTRFDLPSGGEPFFVDVISADPDWQLALEPGKSRPLPFNYEDGTQKAVPTMVCLQNCGIFQSSAASLAILPTAGQETAIVAIRPPDGVSLHDFIPVAEANFDDWAGKAVWGTQRVLLPRFTLKYEGSALPVLDKAGLGGFLADSTGYGSLGNNLYFSDILHMASLVVDESGVAPPDPNAPTYRQNMKDDTPTLALDKPFIAALVKIDENGNCGQILMMGCVRDPLVAAAN